MASRSSALSEIDWLPLFSRDPKEAPPALLFGSRFLMADLPTALSHFIPQPRFLRNSFMLALVLAATAR
jgi:hypothetical protein